ncbi:MAG TPA: hypothetical protein VK166_20490 [Chitinophagaceae bacterium]|nr:hypothetical protein [Chitinophagaceae bacterium]
MKKPIFLVAIFLVFSCVLQAQQHAKVDGKWLMNVETTMGSGSPTFVLKQVNDSTLTGNYTGALGEAEVKGTVNGNKIRLEFTIQANMIEYTGTVDGDTMKGIVKLGTMGEGSFTGKREKTGN